jgi:hypothetical protein
MSTLVSPRESLYPITPPSTADIFGDVRYPSSSSSVNPSRSSSSDVRYSSRSSSADDFTLGANPHPEFLSRSHHVLHESPPQSGSCSPTELNKVGLLPRHAWLDPPVSTTTLDFSTGKSIWV